MTDAGKLIEKLHKNHQTYKQAVDDIRRDWTLSDAAKRLLAPEGKQGRGPEHNGLPRRPR